MIALLSQKNVHDTVKRVALERSVQSSGRYYKYTDADRCNFYTGNCLERSEQTPTIVTWEWRMALNVLFCLRLFSHFPITNRHSLCELKEPGAERLLTVGALTVCRPFCPAFVNVWCVPQIQRQRLHTTTLTCHGRDRRPWTSVPRQGCYNQLSPRRGHSPFAFPSALVTSCWPRSQRSQPAPPPRWTILVEKASFPLVLAKVSGKKLIGRN